LAALVLYTANTEIGNTPLVFFYTTAEHQLLRYCDTSSVPKKKADKVFFPLLYAEKLFKFQKLSFPGKGIVANAI
jgi:hypothetical protein